MYCSAFVFSTRDCIVSDIFGCQSAYKMYASSLSHVVLCKRLHFRCGVVATSTYVVCLASRGYGQHVFLGSLVMAILESHSQVFNGWIGGPALV